MDRVIAAAARDLATGDVLAALKLVALRDDPPALALRGIAMARLGEYDRAKMLLKRAARAFGREEAVARARCVVAEAEIAFVTRDLDWQTVALDAARATLEAHGDAVNAAHARTLAARRLLLLGRLDAAEALLAGLDAQLLPAPSCAALELTKAGIAIRRLAIGAAGAALARARQAAQRAAIPALAAEVENALSVLRMPAARMISAGGQRPVTLAEVEHLLASGALVVDACRNALRQGGTIIPLATRPALFAIARALGESWPGDLRRSALLERAFHARQADESHRARLRVEIARLRAAIRPLGTISATRHGFVLAPRHGREVVVLAPPADERNAPALALLADGEAWSSTALAIALGASTRTAQRALEELSRRGKVASFGRGRARRWTAFPVPGFATSLSLPLPLPRQEDTPA